MKDILSPKLLLIARAAAFILFTIPAILCAQGHDYQTSFQNARVLLNEKLYDQALVQAKWAIASDGSQWGGYYVAGTALVGLQRQGEAITFFQAALVRAPEQAKPIINAAIASCRQISANESQAPAPPLNYSPQYPQAQPNPQAPAAVPEPASAMNSGAPDPVAAHVKGGGFYGTDCPGTLQLSNGILSFQVEQDVPKCQKYVFSVPQSQIKSFGFNALVGLAIGEFTIKFNGSGAHSFTPYAGDDYLPVHALIDALGKK